VSIGAGAPSVWPPATSGLLGQLGAPFVPAPMCGGAPLPVHWLTTLLLYTWRRSSSVCSNWSQSVAKEARLFGEWCVLVGSCNWPKRLAAGSLEPAASEYICSIASARCWLACWASESTAATSRFNSCNCVVQDGPKAQRVRPFWAQVRPGDSVQFGWRKFGSKWSLLGRLGKRAVSLAVSRRGEEVSFREVAKRGEESGQKGGRKRGKGGARFIELSPFFRARFLRSQLVCVYIGVCVLVCGGPFGPQVKTPSERRPHKPGPRGGTSAARQGPVFEQMAAGGCCRFGCCCC